MNKTLDKLKQAYIHINISYHSDVPDVTRQRLIESKKLIGKAIRELEMKSKSEA